MSSISSSGPTTYKLVPAIACSRPYVEKRLTGYQPNPSKVLMETEGTRYNLQTKKNNIFPYSILIKNCSPEPTIDNWTQFIRWLSWPREEKSACKTSYGMNQND